MKIDILSEPPPDIFKDRGRYKTLFTVFLGLAGCGLLLGIYAVVMDTRYYGFFEKAAVTLFIASAVPLFYTGEKLQAYKKLNPQQQEELAELCKKYFEIQGYCDLVARSNRRIIFAEYEACREWAEDRKRNLNKP